MRVETVALLKQIVLMVFFAIFVVVVGWAVRMPPDEADMLRRMPLADEQGVERNG